MSRALGNPHTKSILYEELEGLRDIEDLFRDANSVYILLQIQGERMGSVGHWVALCKNEKGLSYYDPYALNVSQDIQLTGEPPWLEKLLQGKNVDVNRFRHQRFKDEVNTCGRHTVVRSLFWFMNNMDYNRLVVVPIRPFVNNVDTFSSLMTAFLGPSDRMIQQFFRGRV